MEFIKSTYGDEGIELANKYLDSINEIVKEEK